MGPASEHLRRLYSFDERGRVKSSRHQALSFVLVRSTIDVAWAVGANVPDEMVGVVATLVQSETPVQDFADLPSHVAAYRTLDGVESFGLSFELPPVLAASGPIVEIKHERDIGPNFSAWFDPMVELVGPVFALIQDGGPVSLCFLERNLDSAVEARVETAEAWRGRGHAARVLSAWAAAIRASGRTPLYSPSWTNVAALRVASKLDLMPYASIWSIGF